MARELLFMTSASDHSLFFSEVIEVRLLGSTPVLETGVLVREAGKRPYALIIICVKIKRARDNHVMIDR